VVSIPASIAPAVPGVAAELLAQERELIQLCQSPHFTLEKLRAQIERADGLASPPNRS